MIQKWGTINCTERGCRINAESCPNKFLMIKMMSKLLMDRNGMDLEEKYLSVANSPRTVKVSYLGSKVSNLPMLSRGYLDCVGVIIFSDNGYCALSHYDHTGDSPRVHDYIPELLDRIREKSKSDNLECFKFGGNREHMDSVGSALVQNGIREIGEFRDGMRYDRCFPLKSVAVIPEMREVILGYKEKYFFPLVQPIDMEKINLSDQKFEADGEFVGWLHRNY